MQILKEHSDYDHLLMHEEIEKHLENDYGIVIERKAIGRDLSFLRDAGFPIESGRIELVADVGITDQIIDWFGK